MSRVVPQVRAKRTTLKSAVVAVAVAALGLLTVVQAPSASAAEVSVGTQVIHVQKGTTTQKVYAYFKACKISQGSGYYRVRVRVNISSALALGGQYRLNIGSNLGSSTTANAAITGRFSQVSVVSRGKANSTIRFNSYIGKGSSSGYTVWPGTTLRSYTVGSLPTC